MEKLHKGRERDGDRHRRREKRHKGRERDGHREMLTLVRRQHQGWDRDRDRDGDRHRHRGRGRDRDRENLTPHRQYKDWEKQHKDRDTERQHKGWNRDRRYRDRDRDRDRDRRNRRDREKRTQCPRHMHHHLDKKKGSRREPRSNRVPQKRGESCWRWPEARKRDLITSSFGLLPLDVLVEHIFSRLPVRDLCQLRLVCKAWRSVLGGAGVSMPDKAKESWFLMHSYSADLNTFSLIAWSSCYGRTGCVPVRIPTVGVQLSSYLGGSDWTGLSYDYDFTTPYFMTSAGGLICTLVEAQYPREFDMIVFNCFTGSMKLLPSFPSIIAKYPFIVMSMAIDNQDPFQYYVMVREDILRANYMEAGTPFVVFDSRSGGWKVGSSPMTKSFSTAGGRKVADGDVFTHLYHPSDGTMDVMAYHAVEDAWSFVKVPLVSNDPDPFWLSWSIPSFLRYEGRLFMGRTLVKDRPLGFEIWELQFSSLGTATLAEVARTPEHLYLPVSRMLWGKLRGEGSVFYLQCQGANGRHPPLVYDLVQNSWYVVPSGKAVACMVVHKPRPSMLCYG